MSVALNAESQQAEALTLTTNALDDAEVEQELLAEVGVNTRSFIGDGAYDKDKVRKCLHRESVLATIPPQNNVVPDTKDRDYMRGAMKILVPWQAWAGRSGN